MIDLVMRGILFGLDLLALVALLFAFFGQRSVDGTKRLEWVESALDVALAEDFDEEAALYYDGVAACMNRYFKAFHVRVSVTPSEVEMYIKDRKARPMTSWLRQFR